MAKRGKYRVFDRANPIIKRHCARAVAGELSIAEGAILANVNKESFRQFVNEEKAKLAAEKEKAGGGDE